MIHYSGLSSLFGTVSMLGTELNLQNMIITRPEVRTQKARFESIASFSKHHTTIGILLFKNNEFAKNIINNDNNNLYYNFRYKIINKQYINK